MLEVMKDGETGFLVREGNQEDVIEKISLLLNDKELADKFG